MQVILHLWYMQVSEQALSNQSFKLDMQAMASASCMHSIAAVHPLLSSSGNQAVPSAGALTVGAACGSPARQEELFNILPGHAYA